MDIDRAPLIAAGIVCKSTAGIWIEIDSDGVSPCIDAGHPDSPYSLEPTPNGSTNNMGFYGNTDQASKSAYSGLIVINQTPSNVTTNSATLNGQLVSTNASPVAVYIYWGDEDSTTNWTSWDTKTTNGTDVALGTFSNNVSVITNKAYYYRCYATNSTDGADWADNTAVFITADVTIQATDATAGEGSTPDTGTFTVYRPNLATNFALTVNYTIAGTASNGVDYSAIGQSVTIPAGATNATVTITPIDDTSIETTENVSLTLAAGTYLIGSSSNAVVTIADNDSLTNLLYKMKITFDGYDKNETLTNFPALVILNESRTNFSYNQVIDPNGGDLRFVNSNETTYLNYEIEEWNTNNNSYIWVQVPTISSPTDYIWAYWGDASATSPPACTTNGATWSDDFACVYHLVQTNSALTPDSTANNYDSTLTNNAALTNSIIANGVCLDGNGDYVKLPRGDLANSGDLIRKWKDSGGSYTNSAATLCMWVKLVNATPTNDLTSGFACLDQVSVASWPSSVHYPWNTDSKAYLTTFRVARIEQIILSGTIDRDDWHLVTITSDATSGWRFYQNGSLIKTNAQGTFGLDAYNGFTVGATINAGGGSSYWLNGWLDEVRLHRSACSSNWVWATWMNVDSNEVFNVYGIVESDIVFVDTNAVGGANDGSSWSNAYLKLTNALTQSSGAQIWVAEGTFTPGSAATDSFNLNSNHVYGGFAGTEGNLAQRNVTANETILDGASSRRQIVKKTTAGSATLDGFTIMRANGNVAGDDGGGVYWTNGTLTLANCTFTNNYANDQGGAVYIADGLGGVTIENCDFFNNNATYGGAVVNGANALSMTGCVFRANYSSYEGGAIKMAGEGGTTNVFTDCTFTNNYSTADGYNGGILHITDGHNFFYGCEFLVSSCRNYGGGIYLTALADDIVVSNCVFRDNDGEDRNSAIYHLGTGSIQVVDSEFTISNPDNRLGTCIYGPYSEGKTNIFRNSSFTGYKCVNDGIDGGALNIRGGQVELYNCGFTNNESRNYGGAVYLSTLCTDLIVSNCTFTDNRGEDASSAIYHPGTGSIHVVDSGFTTTQSGGGHGQAIYGPDATGRTNTFRNSWFTGHDSTVWDGQRGGALYIRGGYAEFYNCGFTNNRNRDNGGAIYITSAGTDLVVSNCTFTDNNAEDWSCDIYQAAAGSVQIIDSTFSTINSTYNGGASIYAPGSNGKTNLIQNSSFNGYRTTSDNSYGGALRIEDGHLQILGCTFTSNNCRDHGGAVYIPAAVDSVLVSNCTFIGNIATVGGDVYGGALYTAPAATIYNSTFAGNQHNYGAIRFNNGGTIINCTFYTNVATVNGGAIYLNGGTLNITNSIFWGNTAVSGKEIYRNGGTLNIAYSDINTNLISGAYTAGSGVINTDPMFADAANNDFHLKSKYGRLYNGQWIQRPSDGFSPCIDTGHPGSPYALEPWPNGGTNNMGRYGNTDEASKSAYGGLIVLNNGVSNLTSTAATLCGEIVSSNAANAVVRIYWGDEDYTTNASSWDTNELMGTNFSVEGFSTNVSVSADKTYYFRCLATNALGTDWADDTVSFITGDVTIQATDSNATETAGDTATFVVYRPGTCTNEATTVNYSITGTASNGADYVTLPGTVTIAAGDTNASITVTPIDDMLVENAETIILTLTAGNYVTGTPNNATATIAASDSLSGFNYKMKIIFRGYDKSETLTNFPALVTFNTNDMTGFLYSQVASTNGYDLRFADSNELTVLNYEIEEWDTSDNSYVWVQVPTISSTNDYIWAYWGNAGAASQQAYTTNGATWTNSYVGVWHMSETNAEDSTSNNNDGAAQNGAALASAGQIDGACDFDGSDDRTLVSSTFGLANATATLSCWANLDSTSEGGAFLKVGDDTSGYAIGVGGSTYDNTGNDLIMLYETKRWIDSGVTIGTGWHYITMTISDSVVAQGYIDGVAVNTPTGIDAVAPANSETYIGGYTGSGAENRHSDSWLDEVRVSESTRSSNWVWACWMTMGSNSTFNLYGSIISSGGPPTINNSMGATNVTSTSAWLNGNLTSTGALPTEVWVYWGSSDGITNETSWANTGYFGVSGTGLLSTNVTGLSSNTTYFYRFSATNSIGEAWASTTEAWCSQTRGTGTWYLVSVPVHWGSSASNALNATLGAQLATGLTGGSDQNDSDNLWYQDGTNWSRYWLSTTNVWKESGGADATLNIGPGRGFWIKRLTASPASSNTVFTGRAHTNSTQITFSNSVWTIFGWPYSPRTPTEGTNPGWGFQAAGATGSFAWDSADDMIGEYGGSQFPIYMRTNGEWYIRGTASPAGIKLEPGKAYYYYHRGANFTWTAPDN